VGADFEEGAVVIAGDSVVVVVATVEAEVVFAVGAEEIAVVVAVDAAVVVEAEVDAAAE